MKLRITLLLCTLYATAGSAQSEYYYPPNSGSAWETVSPEELGWCTDDIQPMLDFIEANEGRGFIVLYKGRIVLEHYFNGHSANVPWYWASAGKTVTGFLVGKAQENGLLDINEATSTYLGEGWTSMEPSAEGEIKVIHQLTMTTGLDDSGNVDCYDPECLSFLAEPGTRWSYHNAPYTLLTNVVENASGQTINNFLADELNQHIGTGASYFEVDYNKVVWSTPRAMARFGHLILSDGNWNGLQIMTDADYFNAMVTPSQNLNESYGYLWWLNGQPTYMVPGLDLQIPGTLMTNAPADAFFALGKNGQFINVVPSMDLVFIRMGDFPESSLVPFLHNNDIWGYLNDVLCSEVTVQESQPLLALHAAPNPAVDRTAVDFPAGTRSAVLYDGQTGRIVEVFSVVEGRQTLELSGLANGLYLLGAFSADGIATGSAVKLVVQR